MTAGPCPGASLALEFGVKRVTLKVRVLDQERDDVLPCQILYKASLVEISLRLTLMDLCGYIVNS